ncbi:MAG: cell division protein FtsL [Thermodesulfobacteriota bacterium]
MAEAVYKRVVISGAIKEVKISANGVNRHLLILAMIIAFLVITCSLFYVWANQQRVSLGYEISRVSEEAQELIEENKKLRLELAALKSPDRLEKKALQELGFVTPQNGQIIIVR